MNRIRQLAPAAVLFKALVLALVAPPLGAQSRIPSIPVPGSFFGQSTFGQGQIFGVSPPASITFGHAPHRNRTIVVPVFYPPFYYGYGAPMYTLPVQSAPQMEAAGQQDELSGQIKDLKQEVQELRVERLRDEADRLREERRRLEAERAQPERGQASSTPQPPARARERGQVVGGDHGLAVVLVFRDGHRLEVGNYAVVGSTLWDFSEDSSRRIPLSSLDLDATVKLNEQRGAEFRVPDR